MIGIYKIENLINGKIYIGQSNNIKRRIMEHKHQGKKSRILLDREIQQYGADKFSYEVIEETTVDKLNERETY